MPWGRNGNPLQNPIDRGAWQGLQPMGSQESDTASHSTARQQSLLVILLEIVNYIPVKLGKEKAIYDILSPADSHVSSAALINRKVRVDIVYWEWGDWGPIRWPWWNPMALFMKWGMLYKFSAISSQNLHMQWQPQEITQIKIAVDAWWGCYR